jgi:Uma2 family endonuclease
MSTNLPRPLVELKYEREAQAYLRSLTLENYMEAPPQATQRKITLESFDLIHARRPEVQVFNELLVLYPRGKREKIMQIVPDNMVVVHPTPLRIEGHFATPLQPVGPLLVMEYVSKHNQRKDYEVSFRKYERDLKVPYYLIFYPDNEELTLYHLVGSRYRTVLPNDRERYPIPDLELEVALLDGWVRYWFRGELLPLPAQLQEERDEARHLLSVEREARLAAEEETARLRQEIARMREGRGGNGTH